MTTRGYHGDDYPDALFKVLSVAHELGGLAVQSDFTRANSVMVAFAASLGWLSTIVPDGNLYGNRWRCTVAGLQALYHKDHFRP